LIRGNADSLQEKNTPNSVKEEKEETRQKVTSSFPVSSPEIRAHDCAI
jgi:hypothetical protein